MQQPSSGTAAKRKRAAFQFRTAAWPHTSNKEKEKGKIATMPRRTPEQVVDERLSSGSHQQTTMEACTKSKADRDYVNKQWAMWFYECGVPFNAINSRQFHIASLLNMVLDMFLLVFMRLKSLYLLNVSKM
jgi:hypothetical protein